MEIKKSTEVVTIPCPTCRGTGVLRGVRYDIEPDGKAVQGNPYTCPRCHGSKTIQATINKLNIEE